MDEALELVDVVVDSGFEDVFVWVLRLLGVLAVLAGLGLWLLTGMGLLWVPAIAIGVGLLLLVAPQVILSVAELTG